MPARTLAILGLLSCTEDKIVTPTAMSPGPTDGPISTAPQPSTPAPSSTGGTGSTGSTSEPDSAIRFLALGDAGRGNEAQYDVGEAMAQVCDDLGCDFVLYLGDNFYNSGVSSVDDEQFETKFELPYEALDVPFFAVLGNHDLGLEGVGLEFWKAPTYVEYTQYSSKWTMPDVYYSVQWGELALFGLNTTDIFFGLGGDQERWIGDALQEVDPSTSWRIAFGHHPYLSNGPHGNAGSYEGIDEWVPLTEIPRGEFVQEFIEQNICGQFDLYISGHDHSRQWLEPSCGTTFVVSGAGSETTAFEGDNVTAFADDTTEGFLWMEIDGDRVNAKFFDRYANEDFDMSYVR